MQCLRRQTLDDDDLADAAPEHQTDATDTSAEASKAENAEPPVLSEAARAETTVVLSVYFEGTANTLKPITTQIGVFFELTDGIDVTLSTTPLPGAPTALKMGFHGCGVVAGIAGVIWAVGLQGQCAAVATRVRRLLQAWPNAPLVINVLGLSRGGIAALMLAQKLAKLDDAHQRRVRLNLCLYDPVPGNLLWTAQFLDPLGTTTANGVIDVSQCSIASALAIYPHEPLPDLAFHAPLLPIFPSSCAVEEDATLGCHQGALYSPATMMRHEPSLVGACLLSFLRVHSFLVRSGTALRPIPRSVLGHLECPETPRGALGQLVESALERPADDRPGAAARDGAHPPDGKRVGSRASGRVSGRTPGHALEAECLEIMERALDEARPTRRVAHQRFTTAYVVRHASGRFLNRHHLELVASAALSRGSTVLAERLALGLRGLIPSEVARSDALAEASPFDFLPEASDAADCGTPLFMLQVARSSHADCLPRRMLIASLVACCRWRAVRPRSGAPRAPPRSSRRSS